MVATPAIRVTQADVIAAEKAATHVRLTQGAVLAAINFPSENIRVTNASVGGATTADMDIRATQAFVFAAVRGRIEDRRMRAWGCRLDGHDFYILRLDETETVVYDLTTGQWTKWESPERIFLRTAVGMNWDGMTTATFSGGANSTIVAGDDTFGLLWTLDPTIGFDNNPSDSDVEMAFTRTVVGGVPMRLRDTQQVGAVYVTASLGNPQLSGADITLRTSDDSGNTWQDHGTITINPGDYEQELVWRSLGLIRAPGRIFEISDNGASVRIDGLDMR